MRRLMACLAVVTWLVGCGDSADTSAPPPPQAAPSDASRGIVEEAAQAVDAAAPPATPKQVVAHVTITDLEGKPLAGMLPIATRSPNAFDAPVAQGEESGPDGTSTLLLPPGERVFVRAWDPTMSMFANNFYEVPGFPGEKTQPMTVVMVPCSTIEAVVLDEQGLPIAGQEVRLMLIHATKGPWWPAQTISDGEGRVVFPNIPSGQFTIELGSRQLGVAELRGVPLPPGAVVNLERVTLKKHDAS